MEDNIVLNYGAVDALIEKKSDEIINQYLDGERDEFNYVKYDLYETSISSAIEEALTLPFLSDKKVVHIKNAYLFTGEKVTNNINQNVDQLIGFIEQYDGETLVVFDVFNEKLDERKKLVKSVKKNARLNKIDQMTEQEIKQWIKSYLNEQYKDIKEDALVAFLELTGIQFNIIKAELDKLVLFIGDEAVINKQDVKDIVSRSLEQNVFLLTEYIQKGQKEKSINLLKDLINMKEEPIKLLALITSNYRLYYQCKILASKHYSEQQIAKTIGVHPYRVKLALRIVRKLSLERLLATIDVCAETDYDLKSSYMDKVLILELFILKI
ncbi:MULTISPECIES: DNA polymerase III subunit delta [Mammaliicoccus]|uniref:DNA polymerase III subunit delta n=1 Tax=Mammaliicoccus fleurettii TaxID=150056 RepID=A0ABS5MKP4_9STAP|nr:MULTISPECIES: DNA polymerase III subunit delta [Mammaliicoccus]HCN61411.1 DNA polymerase III subunit delta [Staphylococcus sp.]MBL0846256.1 DNA polymerase III subunit delta [Mammaliicoccus fleurettii]MBO3062382.1 DNA polymerase III subunit delta [Mammaliicoccus fleurettii]MBS3671143.1 DNA polymerase III subunit delta [Mammaliicoccus fleurettii]MBS3696483.1 DNA polymerase III subunit delta [Mammaliicoccus fleurettii]